MSDVKSRPALAVPPPAFAALALLAQILLTRRAGVREVPGRRAAAAALAVASAGVSTTAARSLSAHDTTIDALNPGSASTLVTDGVFARSRNPIYVGLALLLTASAAWTGRKRSLLPVAAFVVLMDRMQIPAEEGALAARFGAEYDAYRAATRRWL